MPSQSSPESLLPPHSLRREPLPRRLLPPPALRRCPASSHLARVDRLRLGSKRRAGERAGIDDDGVLAADDDQRVLRGRDRVGVAKVVVDLFEAVGKNERYRFHSHLGHDQFDGVIPR